MPRAKSRRSRSTNPAWSRRCAIAKFREFVFRRARRSVRLMTPVKQHQPRGRGGHRRSRTDPHRRRRVAPAGSAHERQCSSRGTVGQGQGLASLALRFDSLRAGSEIRFDDLQPHDRTDQSGDAKKISIPAACGAILGGILGGKEARSSAAPRRRRHVIVLSTSGKEVALAAGSILRLTLDRDLEVRVAIGTDR